MPKVIRENYWKIISAALGAVVLFCLSAGAKSWGSEVWVTRETFEGHKAAQAKIESDLRANDEALRQMMREHLNALRDLEKAEQLTRERLAEISAVVQRVDRKLPE